MHHAMPAGCMSSYRLTFMLSKNANSAHVYAFQANDSELKPTAHIPQQLNCLYVAIAPKQFI
jgi:hypothetical protein